MRKLRCVLLLGIIVATMFIFTGCGTITVDLNKYINIEASGYDSMGTATYSFDYEAFKNDYSGKIKTTDKAKSLGMMAGVTPAELLLDVCVSQKLDQNKNLSNGDTVTLQWNCDEELAREQFNVKLNYSDIKYKVSGLTEVAKFNPFDYVDISFSGISPFGSVTINPYYDQLEMQYIKFATDKNGTLKNGDTITVTAKISGSVDTFVEKFGAVLGQTSKEYTVDSLPSFVTSIKEIPSDSLNAMIAQGENSFRSHVEKDWYKPENLVSVNYIGHYFMNMKPDALCAYKNQLYLLYKISAINPEPETEVNYYYYVHYINVYTSPDGTCTYDKYQIPLTGWFASETFSVDNWYYVGFQDLDTFFEDKIKFDIRYYEYTYEINE